MILEFVGDSGQYVRVMFRQLLGFFGDFREVYCDKYEQDECVQSYVYVYDGGFCFVLLR